MLDGKRRLVIPASKRPDPLVTPNCCKRKQAMRVRYSPISEGISDEPSDYYTRGSHRADLVSGVIRHRRVLRHDAHERHNERLGAIRDSGIRASASLLSIPVSNLHAATVTIRETHYS